MRDSMVFYRNFRDAVAMLPPEERLKAYEAIFAYALDDQKPTDGISGAIVQLMMPAIDKNNQKYENGKRGGRPKNQTETKQKPNETKPEAKCKVLNDKCKMLSPDGDKKRRFAPPTVEEVREYCRERGNNVDAGQFVDFYAAKGWKVGANSMKDWRAAVRTWERRDSGFASGMMQRPKEDHSEIMAALGGRNGNLI